MQYKTYDILDNSAAITDPIINIVHFVHHHIFYPNMDNIHSIECSISLDCKTLHITENTSQLLVHSVTDDRTIIHTFVYICIVYLQTMCYIMLTSI